jgi:hypothetical protein
MNGLGRISGRVSAAITVEPGTLLPGNAGDDRPGDLVAVVRLADETRWYWRQGRLRGRWLSVSPW